MSIHPADRTHKRAITYFERINKFSQKNNEVKIFGKESKDKKFCPSARQEGTMEAWRSSSIHSAVDGDEWLALWPGRFIPGERFPVNN
jgi:hypothetical protein